MILETIYSHDKNLKKMCKFKDLHRAVKEELGINIDQDCGNLNELLGIGNDVVSTLVDLHKKAKNTISKLDGCDGKKYKKIFRKKKISIRGFRFLQQRKLKYFIKLAYDAKLSADARRGTINSASRMLACAWVVSALAMYFVSANNMFKKIVNG